MRTLTKTLFSVLALQTAACNWTEFDDLKDTTTVSVIGKPSKSSDIGVGLVRGQQMAAAGTGGSFVAYGINKPYMYRVSVSANGDMKYKSSVDLTQLVGISNLETSPITIAHPVTDEVAIVTKTAADQLGVLYNAIDDAVTFAQIFELATVNAAAYILTPGVGTSTTPSWKPIVAGSNIDTQSIIERERIGAAGEQITPKCAINDGAGGMVAARGIAGALVSRAANPEGATKFDDLVVWATNGKLFVYDGLVLKGQVQNGLNSDTGCPALPADLTVGVAGPIRPALDTGYQPGLGSQLIRYSDHQLIAIGHKDTAADKASFIQMFDVAGTGTPTAVGTPINTEGLKSAAVLKTTGGDFLVAGYPFADIEGKRNAGTVQLYAITATGIDPTPVQTIQPTELGDNNNFGRAVAAYEFNGQQIIAVSEEGHLYSYFVTSLYSDVREK